jgi:peptidoglycan/LPS O-acetylase OafA/YrhL
MIGVSWSLGLEVQLYAIYSVVVRHIRRIGVVRIVFGALAVALFWNIASELITRSIPPGQYLPGHKSTDLSHLLYAQAPSRAFEWLLGMLAAEAYHGRVKLPGWTESAYVAVPLAACFGLTFVHPVGALTLGGNGFMASDVVFDALGGVLFFVCLRWICRVGDARLFASRLTARPLRGLAWLGLISYSVYLLHIVMLDVAEKVFGDVGLHGWEQVPFDWVAAIGGCWLFFLAVETRFLVGSKRRATEPRRQRAPVVAAPAVAAPPVAVTPAAAGRRTGTP